MTIDEIHSEVIELEREITDLPPSSEELTSVTTRIRELQGELERTRGTLGPLVPDAASPPSLEEQSATELAGALADLLRAATAKREVPAV